MKRRIIIVSAVVLGVLALALGLVYWRAPVWVHAKLFSELNALGVQVHQLDYPELSWRGVSIPHAELAWRNDTVQVRIDIDQLRTGIEWFDQRVSALDIGSMRVSYQGQSDDTPTPWPAMQLPALPIDEISIKQFSVDAIHDTQRISFSSAVHLVPAIDHWSLSLKQDEKQNQQPQHWRLSLKKTQDWIVEGWWHRDDTQLAHATVTIPSQGLRQQVLAWSSTWDAAALPALLQQTALTTAGTVHADGRITLGEFSGQWSLIDAVIHTEALTIEHAPIAAKATLHAAVQISPETIDIQFDPEAMVTVAPIAEWKLGQSIWRVHNAFAIRSHWRDRPNVLEALGQWRLDAIYDGIQNQWHFDQRDQALAMDLNQPSMPLQFSLQTEQWRFADTQFSQLKANGALTLLQQSDAWQVQLASPASLTWQGIRYGDFSVAKGSADISAAILTDQDFALTSLEAHIQANTLEIQDKSSRYQLNKPIIDFQQKAEQIKLSLNSATASMTDDRQTLSAETVHVSAEAKTIQALTNAVQITAKKINHPSLAEWPQPDIALQAGEKPKGVWNANGALILSSEKLAEFTVRHQLQAQQGNGQLQWQWPTTRLQKMLSKKPRTLAPLALMAGDSNGQFQLAWHKASTGEWQLQINGSSAVQDTAIVWQESSASGIFVDAHVDDLLNLQGDVSARLSAFALAAGVNATELKGQIIRRDQSLELNQIYWKLLDGEWFVPDQQFTGNQTIEAPLAILGLNLEKVLKLFDVHGLSGIGTLDGAIPMKLSDNGVQIEAAELHARVPGRLRYAPGEESPNENIGLKVLRDFHYQTLRVQFDYVSAGDYSVKLTLHGSNPSFYNGYPINLTLNIQGKLPGMFKAALFSGDFNKHILESVGSGTSQP